MSWDAKYALLLLFSTVITYLCGLGIDFTWKHTDYKGYKKIGLVVLVTTLIASLGLLFYFKYTNFFIGNINSVLSKIGYSKQLPSFDIILPIGISFFFQAIGYTIDVYRGEIEAEKNPFRYALFVSFFPQLVAGPIERSKNLLKQLRENPSLDVDNARDGLLTMAYGLFMKIAVADNISSVIDPIFANPYSNSGMTLLFAKLQKS